MPLLRMFHCPTSFKESWEIVLMQVTMLTYQNLGILLFRKEERMDMGDRQLSAVSTTCVTATYKQYIQPRFRKKTGPSQALGVVCKLLSCVRLCDPWTVARQALGSSATTRKSLEFSRKNTGVGCCSLLEGIFLTQGSNPGLLHCGQILYHLSHQGSPLGTPDILANIRFYPYLTLSILSKNALDCS